MFTRVLGEVLRPDPHQVLLQQRVHAVERAAREPVWRRRRGTVSPPHHYGGSYDRTGGFSQPGISEFWRNPPKTASEGPSLLAPAYPAHPPATPPFWGRVGPAFSSSNPAFFPS